MNGPVGAPGQMRMDVNFPMQQGPGKCNRYPKHCVYVYGAGLVGSLVKTSIIIATWLVYYKVVAPGATPVGEKSYEKSRRS